MSKAIRRASGSTMTVGVAGGVAGGDWASEHPLAHAIRGRLFGEMDTAALCGRPTAGLKLVPKLSWASVNVRARCTGCQRALTHTG